MLVPPPTRSASSLSKVRLFALHTHIAGPLEALLPLEPLALPGDEPTVASPFNPLPVLLNTDAAAFECCSTLRSSHQHDCQWGNHPRGEHHQRLYLPSPYCAVCTVQTEIGSWNSRKQPMYIGLFVGNCEVSPSCRRRSCLPPVGSPGRGARPFANFGRLTDLLERRDAWHGSRQPEPALVAVFKCACGRNRWPRRATLPPQGHQRSELHCLLCCDIVVGIVKLCMVLSNCWVDC